MKFKFRGHFSCENQLNDLQASCARQWDPRAWQAGLERAQKKDLVLSAQIKVQIDGGHAIVFISISAGRDIDRRRGFTSSAGKH